MKKRLLALALALCLIMSMLPMSAFAADPGITSPDLPICNHEKKTTTTTEATCQDAGSITVTCDDCGEVISTTPIEQLVHENPGTCVNCAIVMEVGEEPYELSVGNLYYKAYNVQGMILTLSGVSAVTFNGVACDVADGEIVITELTSVPFGNPDIFVIEVAEGVVATAAFSRAVGHIDNKAELVIGENTATVAADANDFYNYTWTAPCTGELTITMSGDDWSYTLNNTTTGKYGTTHYSDGWDSADGTVITSETIAVSKGDVIALNVNTNMSTAGTVTFNADFVHTVPGSCDECAILVALNPQTEEPVTMTQTEGAVYYMISGASGSTIEITGAGLESVQNGKQSVVAQNGKVTIGGAVGMYLPVVVTGSGDITFKAYVPVGTLDNPAELVIGENTATVEAGSWAGYCYTWTAPADGELTITMSGNDWAYTLGNTTTGKYGTTHYSDGYDSNDGTVITSETIAVSKDDVIALGVNTNMSTAGTINFNAEFVEAELVDSNLKINLKAFNFNSYLGAQFIVYDPAITSNYTELAVVVNHNGVDHVLDTSIDPTYFVAEYQLAAAQMVDELTLTLRAKNSDGDIVYGPSEAWSAVAKAYEMLGSYNKEDGSSSAKDLALAKIIVDLLNYSSEAQKAFGYPHADLLDSELANANLGRHASLATVTGKDFSNTSSVTNEGFTGMTLVQHALGIESSVQIQTIVLVSNAVDVDTCKAVCEYEYNGEKQTVTINGVDFIDAIDGMPQYQNIILSALGAPQMRTNVTITVCNEEGHQISEAYTTSIASLAASMKNSAKFGTMVYEMMKYGDSAAYYFDSF